MRPSVSRSPLQSYKVSSARCILTPFSFGAPSAPFLEKCVLVSHFCHCHCHSFSSTPDTASTHTSRNSILVSLPRRNSRRKYPNQCRNCRVGSFSPPTGPPQELQSHSRPPITARSGPCHFSCFGECVGCLLPITRPVVRLRAPTNETPPSCRSIANIVQRHQPHPCPTLRLELCFQVRTVWAVPGSMSRRSRSLPDLLRMRKNNTGVSVPDVPVVPHSCSVCAVGNSQLPVPYISCHAVPCCPVICHGKERQFYS